MAFALNLGARLSLLPTLTDRTHNDAAGFADMLRTASLLPLKGFRHWASTPPVSRRNRQSATGPPGNYPDRTPTGKQRRAYEQQDQPLHHGFTSCSSGRTS